MVPGSLVEDASRITALAGVGLRTQMMAMSPHREGHCQILHTTAPMPCNLLLIALPLFYLLAQEPTTTTVQPWINRKWRHASASQSEQYGRSETMYEAESTPRANQDHTDLTNMQQLTEYVHNYFSAVCIFRPMPRLLLVIASAMKPCPSSPPLWQRPRRVVSSTFLPRLRFFKVCNI